MKKFLKIIFAEKCSLLCFNELMINDSNDEKSEFLLVYPERKYMFKVNQENKKTMCNIYAI